MIIRKITKNDYPRLEDFLYHAIYLTPGEKAPPRSIVFEPEIFVYIDGFGSKPGDNGAVAEQDEGIIGMAWTRIIPAYGHVDDKTPELAISVLPEYRGQGVGTKLLLWKLNIGKRFGYSTMKTPTGQKPLNSQFLYLSAGVIMNRLFELLDEQGYRRTSLSVQKNNPAVRFYERLGYKITDEKLDHAGHEDYILLKELPCASICFVGKKGCLDNINKTTTGDRK